MFFFNFCFCYSFDSLYIYIYIYSNTLAEYFHSNMFCWKRQHFCFLKVVCRVFLVLLSFFLLLVGIDIRSFQSSFLFYLLFERFMQFCTSSAKWNFSLKILIKKLLLMKTCIMNTSTEFFKLNDFLNWLNKWDLKVFE